MSNTQTNDLNLERFVVLFRWVVPGTRVGPYAGA